MIVMLALFLLGLIMLFFGAELLIENGKKLAATLRISPIIIGITLVAFGTSLPEMVVSLLANLKGEGGIALGNIIGSNIANIGLVLGVTAIFTPVFFSYKRISFDLYFLMFITLLPLLFIYLGDLIFWQGLIFILLLGGYCWQLYKKDHRYDEQQENQNVTGIFFISLKIILGMVGLGFGAYFFVLGATGIALALGVSSLVIGMSIVALGTSLPEFAASIVAAKHNETGFVIGNIIGSNIMNIVAVLGFTLLIRPIPVEFSDVATHGIFMVILTVGLFILLKYKGGVTKFPAGIFILIYLLFLYFNFQHGLGIKL